MIHVNVKNALIMFMELFFKELCDVEGPLVSIVPFTKLFYDVHFSLYYQHGWHVERVTIIELFSNTKQGDPLRGI